MLVLLPNALALGVAFGAIATTGPAFNVVTASYRYALVPDRLQGRVGSVILLVAWGTIPLGSITAGFLLEAIGAVETMVALACVMLAVTLAGTLMRTVREAPPVADLQRT